MAAPLVRRLPSEAGGVDLDGEGYAPSPFPYRDQPDLARGVSETLDLRDGSLLGVDQFGHGLVQPARPEREALDLPAATAGSPRSGAVGEDLDDDRPTGGLNLSPKRSRHAFLDLAASGSL